MKSMSCGLLKVEYLQNNSRVGGGFKELDFDEKRKVISRV